MGPGDRSWDPIPCAAPWKGLLSFTPLLTLSANHCTLSPDQTAKIRSRRGYIYHHTSGTSRRVRHRAGTQPRPMERVNESTDLQFLRSRGQGERMLLCKPILTLPRCQAPSPPLPIASVRHKSSRWQSPNTLQFSSSLPSAPDPVPC